MTEIKDYTNLVLNDHGCFTIREHGEYLVELAPMLFGNVRLVLTPKGTPLGWDYGWCYDNGVIALLAANIWDLDTDDEPLGWIKRPTSEIRTAPRRSTDKAVRCQHGQWPGEDCEHCSHRRGQR